MSKKVFLTGATGFVGHQVASSLLREGYCVRALVRRDDTVLPEGVTPVKGDVTDRESLKGLIDGVDAVVHLVGIIREVPSKGVTFEKLHYEASVNVIDEAKAAGVSRFVHMSANGTRPDAVSDYHKTKFRAEEYLINSGLEYTIFRPSLIYGPRDSFINMLASYMKKTPVFSYFGDGSYPMSPVSVYEVADAFAAAAGSEAAKGRIYPLCGNREFKYKELLEEIAEILGKKIALLPVPEFAVSAGISLFGSFQWFPITRDQFIMLTEGNTCPDRDVFRILDIQEKDFRETVSQYLGGS